jgi:phosphatidylserine/phosphatidylglycerophosphate/cardiolipin synthase-like enzyme
LFAGRDDAEFAVLRSHHAPLSRWNAQVLTYAIAHDPALRTPIIETFHAKILLADDERAYIVSANVNRWSRDVSMECRVIITGPCVRPVATLVDAMISVAEPCRPSLLPERRRVAAWTDVSILEYNMSAK